MSPQTSKRICIEPRYISALTRDGIGWGHDLDCGCFDHVADRRLGLLLRLLRHLKGN